MAGSAAGTPRPAAADPPVLVTPRLRLRPYRPSDFETLFRELVLDPGVTLLWDDYADPALSEADRRAMAERDLGSWIEEAMAAGLPTWVVEAADPAAAAHAAHAADPAVAPPGAFVGAAGLYLPGTDLGAEPEVGCMIVSRLQGRGLGSEVVAAIVGDALGRLGLAAVAGVIDERNEASLRMVERLGFVLDGTFLDEEGRPCRRYLRRP